MQLPTPIQSYFSAREGDDDKKFAEAFAPDAIVHDEGKTHRGPEEIFEWWRAAKAKYHHTAEPLNLTKEEEKTIVQARVSGDFPGSPVVLTLKFGLAEDRITNLEIGA